MLIDDPRDVSKVHLLKIYLSKVCCFKLGQGPALMTSFNLDNYAVLAFTISQLNLVPLIWRKTSATTKAALRGDSKLIRRGGIGQLHQRQTRQSDVEMHPLPLPYSHPLSYISSHPYFWNAKNIAARFLASIKMSTIGVTDNKQFLYTIFHRRCTKCADKPWSYKIQNRTLCRSQLIRNWMQMNACVGSVSEQEHIVISFSPLQCIASINPSGPPV